MKHVLRCAALLLGFAVVGQRSWAQPPGGNHYLVSAATTAITIQQPSVNGSQVWLGPASVYCASAQTLTLSWNGTAATSTTKAVLPIPNTNVPATATAWTASNAGSGVTGPVYNIAAGATFLLDLSWFRMGNTGTTTNFTLTANGTCTITIQWTEQ